MSPSSRFFSRILGIGLTLAAVALLAVGTIWLVAADGATAAAEKEQWTTGRSDGAVTRTVADVAVALFVVIPLVGYLGLAWGFAVERRSVHLVLALVQIVLLAALGLPLLWTLGMGLL